MATGQGFAIIDFGGGDGANEAAVSVAGIAGISATTKAEAFILADDNTPDNSNEEHRFFDLICSVTCGSMVIGDGFSIYAVSLYNIVGTYKVRYVWAD